MGIVQIVCGTADCNYAKRNIYIKFAASLTKVHLVRTLVEGNMVKPLLRCINIFSTINGNSYFENIVTV